MLRNNVGNASLDGFLPEFDVRERFEHKVKAPPELVMRVAYELDMQSIWMIRLIVKTRKLILGGRPEKRRSEGLVEETRRIGWGTLVETPGRLLICGAACQPWRGDVTFTAIAPETFARYRQPDQVKIVWTLEADPMPDRSTIFAHEVRAAATDPDAKRKFVRYWRWARFGIIAIRLLLLPAIKRKAEQEFQSFK